MICILINFEVKLDLPWSKNCIISEIFNKPGIDTNRVAVPLIVNAPATSTTSTLFQISIRKNLMYHWSLCLLTIIFNLKKIEARISKNNFLE